MGKIVKINIFYILCFCFFILSDNCFAHKSLMFTNITGGQFTVSWVTSYPCIAKIRLLGSNSITNEYYDDRGKCVKDTTHYITVSELNENTQYSFIIIINDTIDDNDGQMYTIKTGPNLIPIGSILSAGKVFLPDETPASGAIVYVQIFNSDTKSALLSTLVDKFGYWYIELINTRTSDMKNIFNPTSDDNLAISVIGGDRGSANLEYSVMDSKGGKNLYPSIILE